MAAEQPSFADFQFNPPEERLILEYLRPFALGRITGAESVINDDPYRAEPWELLAEHQRDVEESAFFFARKTMVGTRRSRTVGENGTWRTQTSEKRAVDDGGVVAVFRKTLLSYYYLGGNQIMSTGYVMYEYELYVDSHGGRAGTGTYDSILCHVKKSCREVARSNKRKRKREFQAASSSGIVRNPYPYPYPYPGCRSLCPREAPVADGLPESRARNQRSAISLSENSQWRGLPEPACEAPVAVVVVVDDTCAKRNSMISLSRSPELKAILEPPSEASSDAPSENKPPRQEEEPPSDSCNKSETPYSVGELIDILVTADPAATRIFDHL